MRSQRWMVWSGVAATALFLVAQFLPIRSSLIDEEYQYSDRSEHIAFSSIYQSFPEDGRPFTTTTIEPWRILLSLLAIGLLTAGLVLTVRRSTGAAPVLFAAGASSLVGLSLWVLTIPAFPDFGWFAYEGDEAFESTLQVSFDAGAFDGATYGFYLLALAALCAVVSIVASVVRAAGYVPAVTAPPETDPAGGVDD